MSKLLATLAAISTIIVISGLILNETQRPDASTIAFSAWMTRHGKSYASDEEYLYRLSIFNQNGKYVEEHNKLYEQGVYSFDLELNLFADLTNQEYRDRHLMKSFEITNKCKGNQAPSDNLPDAVDWSAKGAVTPIKNQGQCGSCWAFSTTGSLEGAHFIKSSTLLSFSEQQLVDCSGKYGNQGCNGGLMDDAFYYVTDNGITLESKYPYRGVGGTCKYTDADKAFQITDCTDVTVEKELALKAAVNQQPVSVAIDAAHASFQLYKSGVYDGLCGTKLDHGVLAVGYGTLNDKAHWKVKNSWGSSWGSNGYIYIARKGDGKGQCGIQLASSFPIA